MKNLDLKNEFLKDNEGDNSQMKYEIIKLNKSYGIKIQSKHEIEKKFFTNSKEVAEDILEICFKHQVSFLHLNSIIVDYLYDKQ